MKRIQNIILTVLFYLFEGFALLAMFSLRWALRTWSDLKMDEIVFELQAPIAGTGNGMITEYLLKAVLPTALLLLATALLLHFLKKRPAFWGRIVIGAASLVVLSLTLFRAYTAFDVGEYLENGSKASTFIEEQYADPRTTAVTFPQKKRNLISLYLESMELTSAGIKNGGAFTDNFIPELSGIAKENEDFSGLAEPMNGAVSLPGTTVTMSALFGTTSGLPLQVSIGNNNMVTQGSFFPQIRTLGDILKDEGYQQVFLLGSDATFGGRRLYYEEHGNFQILDHPYAQQQGWIPNGYYVYWGYEDEKLFQFAKETLTKLAASEEPFHLTILTVDTHFPGGYHCELCRDEFSMGYANVMACSSRQAASFLEWVQQQDFYEDTAIMITGDHPSMDATYGDAVPEDYQRKVYSCVLNAAAVRERAEEDRLYSTFDFFPTALAALGASIEGDRLGLGTNLFSSRDTLLEEFGTKHVRKELKKKSAFLRQLEAVDANALAKKVGADVQYHSFDAASGEMALQLTRLRGLTAPFARAEAALTAQDGTVLAEGYTKEILPDGSCTLTLQAEPSDYFDGTLTVRVADQEGRSEVVLETRNPLFECAGDLVNYLDACSLLRQSRDVSILMTMKNDGSISLSEEMEEAFLNLGMHVDPAGNGFAALTPSGVHEEYGQQRLVYESSLPSGASLKMTSGINPDYGLRANIEIDGSEYSLGCIGFNLVIFDNGKGSVMQNGAFRSDGKAPGTYLCRIEAGGKLQFLGRVHVRVWDADELPKKAEICAVSYWYEDHPEDIKTALLSDGGNGDYVGTLDGRAFDSSPLHIEAYFVQSSGIGTWYPMEEK